MRSGNQRARVIGAAALSVGIAALAACGGSGDTASDAAPTSTAPAEPTLVDGAPLGAAVNAQYWDSQIDAIDPTIRDFAKDKSQAVCGGSPNMGVTLPIDYGFWAAKNGLGGDGAAWKGDDDAKKVIVSYIRSNYCPEAPN